MFVKIFYHSNLRFAHTHLVPGGSICKRRLTEHLKMHALSCKGCRTRDSKAVRNKCRLFTRKEGFEILSSCEIHVLYRVTKKTLWAILPEFTSRSGPMAKGEASLFFLSRQLWLRCQIGWKPLVRGLWLQPDDVAEEVTEQSKTVSKTEPQPYSHYRGGLALTIVD